MRYVGGKSKIAGEISRAILGATVARGRYVEPFVGGGAMLGRMAPSFTESYVGDISEVALMWRAVVSGWRPPTFISEAEYANLKGAEPSPLRAFAGFGGSFGGKWFGGYARGGLQSNGLPRNHQAESARAVEKVAKAIAGLRVVVIPSDYRHWTPTQGDVVYCDPPYRSTQGYAVGAFDSDEFWRIAEKWARAGAHVFVSEYQAPEGWDCIWQKEHRQSLTRPEQGRGATVEKLFRFSADVESVEAAA